MRKRVIDRFVTVVLICISFGVTGAFSGWDISGWWAVALTLLAWTYARFWSTSPSVKIGFLMWATVVVTACLDWKLPDGCSLFNAPPGLLNLFSWSPAFFVFLTVVVILSNALGRYLPSEVRPATCAAAGAMATWLHPIGYDLTYYHDLSPTLFLLVLPIFLSWVPMRVFSPTLRTFYIAMEPAAVVAVGWLFASLFSDVTYPTQTFYLIYYYGLYFAVPAVAGSILFLITAAKGGSRSRTGPWLIIPLTLLLSFLAFPVVLGSLAGFEYVANHRLILAPILGAAVALLLWLISRLLRSSHSDESQTAQAPLFIWLSIRGWVALTLGFGLLVLVV